MLWIDIKMMILCSLFRSHIKYSVSNSVDFREDIVKLKHAQRNRNRIIGEGGEDHQKISRFNCDIEYA